MELHEAIGLKMKEHVELFESLCDTTERLTEFLDYFLEDNGVASLLKYQDYRMKNDDL